MDSLLAKTYAEFVSSRAKDLKDPVLNILHGAVGMAGEAGECLDSIKKTWIYGKTLDTNNLIEECGDSLFYIQMICNQLGITLETLLKANMMKLQKRYPAGYSNEAAIARADKSAD